ncbi:hypothetical protein Scep_000079 [Stephania cephalantha]|uniref:Methyltransferase type 12 domain-containing protein n=1 Tax=Stephania cephalantha TaxID=152367 RepID=A0AAP0Q2M0_9MAGN
MRGGGVVVAGGAPLVKFSHHRPCLSLSSYDFISLFRFNYASSSSSSSSSLATAKANRPLLSSGHYQRKATKYWNNFYKLHNNKFFKDRHYLQKDWEQYFSLNHNDHRNPSKVVLEKWVLFVGVAVSALPFMCYCTGIETSLGSVGCGVGNAVFPLVAAFPHLFVHACDFSPNAIALVQSHESFREDRVSAFVCDVTSEDLCEKITPSSVDVVTLIFTLSAVSPEKMPFVLQNLKKVLKPGGYVLFRDYAIGDYAQEELAVRHRMIGKNFYVRGDGTCVFYFNEDFLSSLFRKAGFDDVEINVYHRQIENRSCNVVMNRRWIRGVFCNSDCSTLPVSISQTTPENLESGSGKQHWKPQRKTEYGAFTMSTWYCKRFTVMMIMKVIKAVCNLGRPE